MCKARLITIHIFVLSQASMLSVFMCMRMRNAGEIDITAIILYFKPRQKG